MALNSMDDLLQIEDALAKRLDYKNDGDGDNGGRARLFHQYSLNRLKEGSSTCRIAIYYYNTLIT